MVADWLPSASEVLSGAFFVGRVGTVGIYPNRPRWPNLLPTSDGRTLRTRFVRSRHGAGPDSLSNMTETSHEAPRPRLHPRGADQPPQGHPRRLPQAPRRAVPQPIAPVRPARARRALDGGRRPPRCSGRALPPLPALDACATWVDTLHFERAARGRRRRAGAPDLSDGRPPHDGPTCQIGGHSEQIVRRCASPRHRVRAKSSKTWRRGSRAKAVPSLRASTRTRQPMPCRRSSSR